ncbi:hypothetical protein F4859DRAFT_351842 [Xylaria cf. heliscus]|nr:hypothetical protein F4859DRAFT_351842 [Xylaria cf. heliscus]
MRTRSAFLASSWSFYLSLPPSLLLLLFALGPGGEGEGEGERERQEAEAEAEAQKTATAPPLLPRRAFVTSARTHTRISISWSIGRTTIPIRQVRVAVGVVACISVCNIVLEPT